VLDAKTRRDFGYELSTLVLDPALKPNSLSMQPVCDAAYHHLWSWITEGEPPPRFPLIAVAAGATEIARDQFGNARGGLRMPQLVAPTARYSGLNPAGGSGYLFGEEEPFSPEILVSLYPDREVYLTQFAAGVDGCIKAGSILPRDRDQLLQEAKQIAPW
jgi:hypothetical protein